jgi:hypothetical protein
MNPRFKRAWVGLSKISQCDALGSMECRRVYAEWVAAGRPASVYTFIRDHANAPVPPRPNDGSEPASSN